MEEIIACSNESDAIRGLYYLLPNKFQISEDHFDLRIGHTSHICLIEDVSPDTVIKLKNYCDAYTDGYDVGYSDGIERGLKEYGR